MISWGCLNKYDLQQLEETEQQQEEKRAPLSPMSIL